MAEYFPRVIDPNVLRILEEGSEPLVPYKIVDGEKVERWNTQLMNSITLQHINAGDGMERLARNLASGLGMSNYSDAVRNARTALTASESRGQFQSMRDARQRGIKLKKQWIAFLDNVTRDSHADLNEEIQDLEKPFGNGLMFPGDAGSPEEVYNCRCTMDEVFEGIDYEEVHVVEGHDITESWVRDETNFDFEIDDVIHAQGFDGLPRVVGQSEFEEAARLANDGNGFVAQRVYSAPDAETLEAYRNELYNGKWYVDCSNGGCGYGRGMYGSFSNGTQITAAIDSDMERYARGATFYNVETFTLDPSAKVVGYDELLEKALSEVAPKMLANQVDGYLNGIDTSFLGRDAVAHECWNAFVDDIRNDPYLLPQIANGETSAVENFEGILSPNVFSRMSSIEDGLANIMENVNNFFDREYMVRYGNGFDFGAYAARLGYDAMETGIDRGYVVVLNRTKVIFMEGE